MKNNPVIAKYAVALFNIAMDRKVVDGISERLSALDQLLLSSPSITGFFLNPSVIKDEKINIIKKALPKDSTTEILESFCEILLKKGRFALLSEIVQEYESYRKSFKNEKDVYITSAFAVSETKAEQLKKDLSSQLSSVINLIYTHDPELIGGIIVEIDGIVYDGSVKGTLKRIHSALRGE